MEHPTCFISKKLDRHQRSYSTVEKEALALKTAVDQFQIYLDSGRPITVYTDHSPLQFLDKMANTNSKLLRWRLFLQQFPLVIRHRPGRDNLMSDILSRPGGGGDGASKLKAASACGIFDVGRCLAPDPAPESCSVSFTSPSSQEPVSAGDANVATTSLSSLSLLSAATSCVVAVSPPTVPAIVGQVINGVYSHKPSRDCHRIQHSKC